PTWLLALGRVEALPLLRREQIDAHDRTRLVDGVDDIGRLREKPGRDAPVVRIVDDRAGRQAARFAAEYHEWIAVTGELRALAVGRERSQLRRGGRRLQYQERGRKQAAQHFRKSIETHSESEG